MEEKLIEIGKEERNKKPKKIYQKINKQKRKNNVKLESKRNNVVRFRPNE